MLRIAGTVNDSIVDGPGIRFSLFVQGCPHHCPGCHNPTSHDLAGGKEADASEILAQIGRNPLLDGVTFTGGEPLCQAEALLPIARALPAMGLNLWIYTGYVLEDILRDPPPGALELIGLADVLVDGPFILAERSLELTYYGSRNQRLLDAKASLQAGRAVLWKP